MTIKTFESIAASGSFLDQASDLADVASVPTSRTNLGLGTGDSPQFTGVNVGHASDTTITRSSAGVLAVEGVTVPLNSVTNIHTAQQIELGHASDTTITRTGAGAIAVEGTAVLLSGGALGTPSSGTLTNATGLPISTGVSGLGTNVATALAVAVGSAGAPVVNGGVLGTPSSGTLTNCTGLPASTGVTGLGGAATLNVGTTTGTVAAGDDSRFSPSQNTLTIASGEITFTGTSMVSLVTVDTEAAAASDTLTTINGGSAGQIIVVVAADSTRTVILEDDAGGNLRLPANFSLDNSEDAAIFVKVGSTWRALSTSDNSA